MRYLMFLCITIKRFLPLPPGLIGGRGGLGPGRGRGPGRGGRITKKKSNGLKLK